MGNNIVVKSFLFLFVMSVIFACNSADSDKDKELPSDSNNGQDSEITNADTDSDTDQKPDTGSENDIKDTEDSEPQTWPCAGIKCSTPPDNVCESSTELNVFNSYGWCEDGECVYKKHEEFCISGNCKSGACVDYPCQGVRCNLRPPVECADEEHLRIYNKTGFCVSDEGEPSCNYASIETVCKNGCKDNKCTEDDLCANMDCDNPPAKHCDEQGNLVRWDNIPRCQDGFCLYVMVHQECDMGCKDGKCVEEPSCDNTYCSSPPANFCLDENVLKSFESNGVCDEGVCIYNPVYITCADKCENGQCSGEPCAGISCNYKPVPYCEDANTIIYWDGNTGTCTEGVCAYGVVKEKCPGKCEQGRCTDAPCIGVVCDLPPVPVCSAEGRSISFISPGECRADGTCNYSKFETSCPDGCKAGSCILDNKDTDKDTETDSESITDSDTQDNDISNVLIIGNAGEGGKAVTENGILFAFEDGALQAKDTVTVSDITVDTVEIGEQLFSTAAGFYLQMPGTASTPPSISFPNTKGLTSKDKMVLVEIIDDTEELAIINLVGTVVVSDDEKTLLSDNVSDKNRFLGSYGADEAGIYLVVILPETLGFVFGKITDAQGKAAGGVFVNTTAALFVGVSAADGTFAVLAPYGPIALYASDPISGQYGNAAAPSGEDDVVVQLDLIESDNIVEGLPNGCLDSTDSGIYRLWGDSNIVNTLGPVSPMQGSNMVMMSSSAGTAAQNSSGLDFTITVPNGISTITFSYMLLSNETDETFDSSYNDKFYVILYTPTENIVVVETNATEEEMFDSETDFAKQTMWRNVSINVSQEAGTKTPITVSMFIADTAGDDLVTAMLIDNLHFDELNCETD